MLCSPETTLHVANTEQVTLSLDVATPLLGVRLEPRFGEAQAASLDGGSFVFPKFDAPNRVIVRWEGDTVYKTYVDVTDRQYFRLEDLCEYGDGRDEFYGLPNDELYRTRQAAIEIFEQAAHRSFVHRFGRTKDYGKGLAYLEHNDVYELLTAGYRLTSDCQVEDDHSVFEPYPRWIEYFYGLDSVPEQVSRAVLELSAYMLRPSNRPLGATSESTDAGYIHFVNAGINGADTDIPEVNAAIAQFGRGEHILW